METSNQNDIICQMNSLPADDEAADLFCEVECLLLGTVYVLAGTGIREALLDLILTEGDSCFTGVEVDLWCRGSDVCGWRVSCGGVAGDL